MCVCLSEGKDSDEREGDGGHLCYYYEKRAEHQEEKKKVWR